MDIDIDDLIVKQRANKGNSTGVSFLAGFFSGCAGTIIGQPFDTIKVRLQTAAPRAYKNAHDCALKMIQREGSRSLFNGIGPPLLATPFNNAITFVSYSKTSQFLRENNEKCRSHSVNDFDPPFIHTIISGASAGAFQSIVLIPSDNIKTKLQVQVRNMSGSVNYYDGPFNCASRLVRYQGFSSLYTGSLAMLCREVPSCAVYFSVYETIKNKMRHLGLSSIMASSISGGIAGCLSWATAFPFDVIKSRQQAAVDGNSHEARSIIKCSKRIFSDGGLRAFYRGLDMAILRAFPVNAVIFPVYDLTENLCCDFFEIDWQC